MNIRFPILGKHELSPLWFTRNIPVAISEIGEAHL